MLRIPKIQDFSKSLHNRTKNIFYLVRLSPQLQRKLSAARKLSLEMEMLLNWLREIFESLNANNIVKTK